MLPPDLEALARRYRQADVDVAAELLSDQPTNACGYIAAEAVVNLRNNAMARGSEWLRTRLPEYSCVACVIR